MNRRNFNKQIGLVSGLIAAGGLTACASDNKEQENKEQTSSKGNTTNVSPELSQRMYDKALAITKSKVRGGEGEAYFKKPFIDAAFNKNIFLWDSCFMACYKLVFMVTQICIAKYEETPIRYNFVGDLQCVLRHAIKSGDKE